MRWLCWPWRKKRPPTNEVVAPQPVSADEVEAKLLDEEIRQRTIEARLQAIRARRGGS